MQARGAPGLDLTFRRLPETRHGDGMSARAGHPGRRGARKAWTGTGESPPIRWMEGFRRGACANWSEWSATEWPPHGVHDSRLHKPVPAPSIVAFPIAAEVASPSIELPGR
jgi:hypothetical protein